MTVLDVTNDYAVLKDKNGAQGNKLVPPPNLTIKNLKVLGLMSDVLEQDAIPSDTTKAWFQRDQTLAPFGIGNNAPGILKFYVNGAWATATTANFGAWLVTKALTGNPNVLDGQVGSRAILPTSISPAKLRLGLFSALSSAPSTAGMLDQTIFLVGPNPDAAPDPFNGHPNSFATWDAKAATWGFLPLYEGATYYDVGLSTMRTWHNGAWQLSVPAAGNLTDPTKLPLDGSGTMTGSLKQAVGAQDCVNSISRATGHYGLTNYLTGGIARWQQGVDAKDPFLAANAGDGDNWFLSRYDNGPTGYVAETINRITGARHLEAAALRSIAADTVSDPTALTTLKNAILPIWDGVSQIPVSSYAILDNTNGAYNGSLVAGVWDATVTPLPINTYPGVTVTYGRWRNKGQSGYSFSGGYQYQLIERIS
jgi:hypothetical protein